MNPLASALMICCLAAVCQAASHTGRKAPDFRFTAFSGRQLSLADLAGSVSVLDFLAPSCPPCRISASHLNGLQSRHTGRRLQIIGMNIDPDSEPVLRRFVAERGVSYPVGTVSGELQDAFGIRSVPHIVVIDRQGRIAGEFDGFNDDIAVRLDRLVEELL